MLRPSEPGYSIKQMNPAVTIIAGWLCTVSIALHLYLALTISAWQLSFLAVAVHLAVTISAGQWHIVAVALGLAVTVIA